MQSSFYRRTMPKLFLALVAVTVGVFMSRGESATAAGTFNPGTLVTLTNLGAGANPDITTALTIPINDYNFSAVLNGTPSAAFVAPGPGNPGFVSGTHPALGDVVGTLSSSSTLGLTGNPCMNSVFPNFTFVNATVNNAFANTIDAVPQASTNPSSGGTLDNMWSDDGSSTTGPDATAPWNLPWGDGAGHGGADDGNRGLSAAERTNGLPAQVERFPSYLNILFDPDYTGGDPFTGAQPVQPLARYAGAVNVVGTSVVLDLVIFAPGALAGAGFGANHPFTQTSSIGYVSVAVLNDSTVEASHGSISDFCSPLFSAGTVFGMAKANPCSGGLGGAACDTAPEISAPVPGANTLARYANPVAGTYSWDSQVASLRDSDGDGIENALDACATTADTYNPRTDTGPDGDNDGLPDACDPSPAVTNTDHDGDGWENSYDNCPLNNNPTQADAEVNVAYATTAPDGGPRGDSIGDACDADDVVSNGAFVESRISDCFAIGGAAATTDSDGDGYSCRDEGGTPLCDGINNDTNVGSPPAPDDAVVDDGCPGGPAVAGLYSEAQFHIGTSAAVRCGVGIRPALSHAWPSDFASGQIPSSTDRIQIYDLSSFLAPAAVRRIGTSPGNGPYSSRWDLAPGRQVFATWINASDITTLTGANLAVPQNAPPMLGGVRAWGGPICTD